MFTNVFLIINKLKYKSMIIVKHKSTKKETIEKMFPGIENYRIVDVTSKTNQYWYRFLSPLYPHLHIPVPFSHRMATSVESIYQGLKVFENMGVDVRLFKNDTMTGLTRSETKYGKYLGHKMLDSGELLSYGDARRLIYIPTYKWMLDNCYPAHRRAMELKKLVETGDLVLLDYNSNPDYTDLSRPVSHASLLKAYLEDCYPTGEEDYRDKSIDMERLEKEW